jgi:tetratricopeptide (TPR) repeat protein
MKKILFVSLLAVMAVGCSNTATPVVHNSNSAAVSSSPEKAQTAIAHSSENGTPPNMPVASGEKSKWTQSGDAFDTSEFDAAITAAEKALSAKPSDGKLKLALGTAYLKRAVALTEKRQYASALGDYRRTLKYDPSNAEAKQWIEQIINIYKSINRSYPAEGEEPPPLPFNKGGK